MMAHAPVPRLEIDLAKIGSNARRLREFCGARGIDLTAVTKGVAGSPRIAQTFLAAGIPSLGDARVSNLEKLRASGVDSELILIRSPVPSEVDRVVASADISVNTELEVLRRLDSSARRQNRVHQVILMVEFGDRREGLLPRDVAPLVQTLAGMPGLRLLGLGTNLACLRGQRPSSGKIRHFSRWVADLQDRFGGLFPRISGGNSANYQWMKSASDWGLVNHVRLGESILLGCDSVSRRPIPGLHTNAFSLVTEVIELKEKPVRGFRTMRRALLALGRQDLEVTALRPRLPFHIVGATSDHLVVDVRDSGLRVGDEVAFDLGYAAMRDAMASPYVTKSYVSGAP